MKNKNINLLKLRKSERHVRWNWEVSPELSSDNFPYTRYHFVVVNDKNREGIMNNILSGLIKYSSIIPIRRQEGKVFGTKFRYLFCSYDSLIRPEMIDWAKVHLPLKRDRELYERKVGNIEDYVEKIYGS